MSNLNIILGATIMVNLIHLGANKARLVHVQEEIKELKKMICDSREEIEEWIDESIKELGEKCKNVKRKDNEYKDMREVLEENRGRIK